MRPTMKSKIDDIKGKDKLVASLDISVNNWKNSGE
jgi:hypothetical protein